MSGELLYLVYPDDAVADELGDALQGAGFKVLGMRSDAEAEDVLNNFKYVLPDALLTPLDDPASDDAILFKLLAANPLMEQVPVVIFASGDTEQRRQALRMGLTNLVLPPYDPEEVILTTQLALAQHRDENRLFGSLAQLPVPDLLQTVEVGRRSGTIFLHHRGVTGCLWIRDGIIVHGEIDDGRQEEEAVYAMALWTDGTFEADFTQPPPADKIALAPSAMLLDAMRRIDEEKRGEAAAEAEGAELRERPGDEGGGPTEDQPHRTVPRSGAEALREPQPSPERTAREATAVHLSLVLLNLLATYAQGLLAPSLLQRRLEAARQALERQFPELRIFQVTPEGLVAVAFDVTVVLTQEGLVEAVAAWVTEFLSVMERAIPHGFNHQQLTELTASLEDRIRDTGLLAALQAAREGGQA